MGLATACRWLFRFASAKGFHTSRARDCHTVLQSTQFARRNGTSRALIDQPTSTILTSEECNAILTTDFTECTDESLVPAFNIRVLREIRGPSNA